MNKRFLIGVFSDVDDMFAKNFVLTVIFAMGKFHKQLRSSRNFELFEQFSFKKLLSPLNVIHEKQDIV